MSLTPASLKQSLSRLALSLLLALPQGAVLAKEDPCSAYAATAAAQNKRNVGLGCGFTGPRWSSDPAGHIEWCETAAASIADLTRETNKRKALLARCAQTKQQKAAKKDACTAYANSAVAAQERNLKQGCHFTGEAWSANWSAHFAWCAKVDKATSDKETAGAGCGICYLLKERAQAGADAP
jgi:hypothetical protein